MLTAWFKRTSTARASNAVCSLVFASLLAAACTSAPKVPPAPLAAFTPTLALQSNWTVQTGAALSADIVIDASQNLLLAPYSNEVAAYHAQTGALLWRTKGLGLVEAPLSIAQDGKSVLALVQGKEAVSLDAKTGNVLWRAVLPAEMYVQAASMGGVFVILTADGRVLGLDEDSGRRRWALARSIPTLTVRGSGAVVGMDGMAVIGLQGGKVIALRPSNGQIAWESGLADVRGVNEVERIADVVPYWQTVPSLGVCATAYRHRMSCLDKAGKVSFTQTIPAISGLVFTQSPQLLAAIDESGDLKAWSVAAGLDALPVWSFEGLRGRKGAGLKNISAIGEILFVSDELGFIHGISAKTGLTVVRTQLNAKRAAQLWTGEFAHRTTLIASGDFSIQSWSVGAQ